MKANFKKKEILNTLDDKIAKTGTSRADIRKAIRAQRNEYSIEQQKIAADKLLERLSSLPEVLLANNIAVYLANDGELDPIPFIKWCWQQHKNVYLPVIHPFTKGHLLFLKYDKNTEMVSNKYGIKEPKLSSQSVIPLAQLNLLFTPLVAFDEQGNRLGMGGGFYDRTLSAWFDQHNYYDDTVNKTTQFNQTTLLNGATQFNKKLSNLKPIGLAHDFQKLEAIPSEHWDIPLPEIITPSRRYHFNEQ